MSKVNRGAFRADEPTGITTSGRPWRSQRYWQKQVGSFAASWEVAAGEFVDGRSPRGVPSLTTLRLKFPVLTVRRSSCRISFLKWGESNSENWQDRRVIVSPDKSGSTSSILSSESTFSLCHCDRLMFISTTDLAEANSTGREI